MKMLEHNWEKIGTPTTEDANRIPEQAIIFKLYEGDEARQRNKWIYKHLRPE
jgi:hypothetical protein